MNLQSAPTALSPSCPGFDSRPTFDTPRSADEVDIGNKRAQNKDHHHRQS